MSQIGQHPNRRCSHARRLHLSGSLHSSSIESSRASAGTILMQSDQAESLRRSSGRTMSALDDDTETRDASDSLAGTATQADTRLRSESLPRYDGTEDFLSSTPPRRASSIFGHNSSHGSTILVRATPFFDQDHAPQRDQSEALTERTRLRTSLISLREQLRASTGMINNLRTRNQVHAMEVTAREGELQKAQDDRHVAWEKARDDSENDLHKRRALMAILGLIAVGVVVYCYWCWCAGPEMSYIRRRRAAVLLE